MNSKAKVEGKRLYSTNFIYLAVLESGQSHSQFSIHLSIFFLVKLQANVWRIKKKRLDAF